MATKYHNLSAYNAEELPSADILKRQRYAIAVADWNSDITYALLDGAYDTLVKHGVKEKNIKVVATGGLSELVKDEVGLIDVVDRRLSLLGIKMIYDLNKG